MVAPAMGWPPTMPCRDRKRWPTAQIAHLPRDHLGVATRRSGCKAVRARVFSLSTKREQIRSLQPEAGTEAKEAAWHGQGEEVAHDDLSR
jgi:hypothetical protein